jgi:hypothetical protein
MPLLDQSDMGKPFTDIHFLPSLPTYFPFWTRTTNHLASGNRHFQLVHKLTSPSARNYMKLHPDSLDCSMKQQTTAENGTHDAIPGVAPNLALFPYQPHTILFILFNGKIPPFHRRAFGPTSHTMPLNGSSVPVLCWVDVPIEWRIAYSEPTYMPRALQPLTL